MTDRPSHVVWVSSRRDWPITGLTHQPDGTVAISHGPAITAKYGTPRPLHVGQRVEWRHGTVLHSATVVSIDDGVVIVVIAETTATRKRDLPADVLRRPGQARVGDGP